jgi:quercetin dioxygenase-like cupin family protein
MNQRQEIAIRIKGLRDSADLAAEEVAKGCGVPLTEYLEYESGAKDTPMSLITTLAAYYKIEPTAILTGGNAHAKVYHLTRLGSGPVVERRKEYHYEGLATQFQGKLMDAYMVTVEPKDAQQIHLNTHPGQEFNLVMEGRLKLVIDGHELILEKGDSLYFDSSRPHGMAALGGKAASFLAVITDSRGEKR